MWATVRKSSAEKRIVGCFGDGLDLKVRGFKCMGCMWEVSRWMTILRQ